MYRFTNIQTITESDGKTHEQVYCFGHLWGSAFFRKGTKDYEEYLAIIKRLAEYEDLEEQGKLLKLPCKVASTVYSLECGKVETDVVASFMNDGENLWFINRLGGYIGIYGKTVFLTIEEAESALQKINEMEEAGNERDFIRRKEN